MRKLRSVIVGLLAITLFLGATASLPASGLRDGTVSLSQTRESTEIQVIVSAAQSTVSWDDRLPGRQRFDLPLLHLHHEREAAAKVDRTLIISISGLTGGTKVEIEAISRHVDVSTGKRHGISTRFLLPGHPCTTEDPCRVRWTLDAATALGDFYTLSMRDEAGHLLWQNPYPDRPDFVALDTWHVELDVYTVRVVYAALFPFARGQNDLENRLAPGAVTDFIEGVFVPLIADTWHTQFQAWGFDPIQPDWDTDKVVEIVITDLPFALFDGTGTYTRLFGADGHPYPERRIWWYSSNNSFQVYDSLENGYKALFPHEFFHLVQWNTLLSRGRPENLWLSVFIEAQGRFAPSVQHPELEIGKRHLTWREGAYLSAANRFLGLRLNTSYTELEADKGNKYDAALYWRFLYEQFGHMGIVRAALEEMTTHFGPDVVASMRRAMDAAFARFDGPFQTFEESLVAFAQANYALRLENGRCAAGRPAKCGGKYYDPNTGYIDPPLEAALDYEGTLLTYDGAIPASYGMDFLELWLDPAVNGQPLVIGFQGQGTAARFSVQAWKLDREGDKLRAATPHPEVVRETEDGAHLFIVPSVDTTSFEGLALIVTRLDADETMDPEGKYHITIDSTADTRGK